MARILFTSRVLPAVVGLVASATLAIGNVQAQELGQLEAQMRKATEDAKVKAQSGQKPYSLQSNNSVDSNLNTLKNSIGNLVNCAGGKSGFNQQYSVQIAQSKQMLGYAQQLLSNPVLKAFAAGPLASILPPALQLTQTLASSCQNYSGSGGIANAKKYDQVSTVMKQVFTAGDLSPNSRAVRHAADVDMPARGGTPDSLRAYLNSQNGAVKNWYKTNFGLR